MKKRDGLRFLGLIAVFAGIFAFTAAPGPVPGIFVDKTCDNAAAQGEPITFSAIVRNIGSDVLAGITCADDPYVPLTGVPTMLGLGEEAVIAGSYIPGAPGSYTDTITCRGTGVSSRVTVRASDSATCAVPPPPSGCTYTPGYWKNHRSVWFVKSNETFYLSGITWFSVLWTAPRGNAYYILAFQYIAASLNVLRGASVPPDVVDVLTQARALFSSYTPVQVAAMRGDNAVRQLFISAAETLDDYNNGTIGPGHCE